MEHPRLPTSLAFAAICGLLLSSCSQPYSKVTKKSAAAVAGSPEQRSMSKALKPLSRQPLAKIGGYLDAANASRAKLAANPSDSVALSDYNYAVSRIMEIIEEADLTPWIEPVACQSAANGPWNLSLTPMALHPEITPSDFEVLPADRYDFKGKLVGERLLQPGLGAPLIAAGKGQDFTELDEFAMGKRIYYGLTAAIRFNGKQCEIILRDPLNVETLQLDGLTYPLAADYQAAISLAMSEMNPEKREISALFKPDQYQGTARLARLQPYDPKKIPVLFIHGLSNCQATWAPMVTSLRQDPTIRKHYQFWVFSYPSGQPYAIPAADLRQQLDKIAKHHPGHKDIVVVGHSMGGMISRTLITDSGTTLWDTVFDKPPGEMGFSEETRTTLSELLIYKARPDVSRVIYASASHRGSELATGFLGHLGAKIVGNPVADGEVLTDEVLAASRNGAERKRIPNSVDVLDPESPFLLAVDTLPPKAGIPYHSIIGDRGKGGNRNKTTPVSTDGIVPYWSSHLDGAQSELIIPSEHWTILEPEGIAEVKRILKLHLN